MACYVIADGGGTKTRFQLLDRAGEAMAEVVLPGSNPSAIGVDASVEILRQGVERLTCMAGISVDLICRGRFLCRCCGGSRGVLKGYSPFRRKF